MGRELAMGARRSMRNVNLKGGEERRRGKKERRETVKN
jgi:hypothetical protein